MGVVIIVISTVQNGKKGGNIMERNNYLANDNSISKQLSDQIELNDNLQRQLEIVNIALQTKIKNWYTLPLCGNVYYINFHICFSKS